MLPFSSKCASPPEARAGSLLSHMGAPGAFTCDGEVSGAASGGGVAQLWPGAHLPPDGARVLVALVAAWAVTLFGTFLANAGGAPLGPLKLSIAERRFGRIPVWAMHTASALTALVGIYLAFLTCDADALAPLLGHGHGRVAGAAAALPAGAPHCRAGDALEAVTACGAYSPLVSDSVVGPAGAALAQLIRLTFTEKVGLGCAALVSVGLACGFLGDFVVSCATPLAMLLFGVGHLAYVIAMDAVLQLCASSNAAALLAPLRGIFGVVVVLCGMRHVLQARGWASPLTFAAAGYSLVLMETAAKGVAVALMRPHQFAALGVGTALFLLSDLAVAARLFGHRNSFGIWPLSRLHISDFVWLVYSSSQMLIALSIASMHSFVSADPQGNF